MTPQTRTSLKELQQLDQDIAQVRSAVQELELLLEEVDAPVLRSEQDVKGLQKRLQEVKLVEQRVELSIEERQVRSKKLEGRMEEVRNVREEAAVHAELEMVRRALENDEQEALSLLDQIRRIEERLDEQDAAYQEALTEVEPRRVELTQERLGTEERLEELKEKRKTFAEGIDPSERRVYESIMAGSTGVAVSELMQDGACGNCFSVVPLQVQNEIRHGTRMIRCEGCGVILTPESAEGIARAEAENERIMEALELTEEERDVERAVVAEAIAAEAAEEAAVVEEVVETGLAAMLGDGGVEPEPEAAPGEEAAESEPEAALAEEEATIAAPSSEATEDSTPMLDEVVESDSSSDGPVTDDDAVADEEAGV